MTWEAYRLDDTVVFPHPATGRQIAAQGMFIVHAESPRRAGVTARLHLCAMLHMAGLLSYERSESNDDLAE